MARKSLRVASDKISRVKQAFKCTGLTQQELATEIDLQTRQPIGKFLNGKPVDHNIFKEICHQLNLEWRDIADLSSYQKTDDKVFNIEQDHDAIAIPNPSTNNLNLEDNLDPESPEYSFLKAKIRSYFKQTIKNCFTSVGLSYLSLSVNLESYIPVNLFDNSNPPSENPQSYSWDELILKFPKILILGKPGAGKTTLLNYIANQINNDEHQSSLIPILISLYDFAEKIKENEKLTLIDYLEEKYFDDERLRDEFLLLLKHGTFVTAEVREKGGKM